MVYHSHCVGIVSHISGKSRLCAVGAVRCLNFEANKRSLRTEQIPYIRGDILDRNGELLSVSVENYSVIADPKEIFSKNSLMEKDRWQRLSEALKILH